MRRFRLEPGALIRIRDVPYRVIAPETVDGVERWSYVHRTSPVALEERQPTHELERLHDVGLLVGDDDPDADDGSEAAGRRRARRLIPLSDLPAHENKRVRFRIRVLREVEERTTEGLRNVPLYENDKPVYKPGRQTPETLLSRELEKIGDEIGTEILGKPVAISVSAYYDWRNKYFHHLHQNDLAGDFEGRGNREQLAPVAKTIIRDVMAELLEAAKYKKHKGGRAVVSMKEIVRVAASKIGAKASAEPDIPNLRVPSPPVFYGIYNEFPAYLRDLAKHGPTKVRAMYRYPNPEQVPDHSLAIVQFDETRLPFFCVHEELGIPLGRPWLAWLVDERSQAIIGFYLGFSNPSDMVVASVLRHACSHKSYISTEYPSIGRRWICSGIPKLLLFDNSLQAHAHSINEITGNIDVPLRFTPSRMPWIKGHVEGSFEVANRTWLREMDGFTLGIGEGWAKSDYDPQANAVVGFRHLLLTLHHWVLDYYHQRRLPHLLMTPHERWLEGCQLVQPEFLSKGTDLDLIFGIIRRGRLDHRGVRFLNLFYYSDDVDRLRRRAGAVTEVEVKYDPLNLSVVHVRLLHGKERAWIRAEARELRYAGMVEEHTHHLYRQHADRVFGRSDGPADWIEASQHLASMVKRTDLRHLTVGARTHLARAAGLSTAHVFSGMDHDGRLGRMSGSLAGAPLDPYAVSDRERPHLALPSPPSPQPGSVLAISPELGSQPSEQTPARRRTIKPFEADKSLWSGS